MIEPKPQEQAAPRWTYKSGEVGESWRYLLYDDGKFVGQVLSSEVERIVAALNAAREPQAGEQALREAVRHLYYAAVWHADRSVDEQKLWTDIRDAAGFEPGNSPQPQAASARAEREALRDLLQYAEFAIGALDAEAPPRNTMTLLRAACKRTKWVLDQTAARTPEPASAMPGEREP